MELEIVRTAAPVGAEILGVDLRQNLSADDLASVERLFNEHGVIFFAASSWTQPPCCN